MTLDKLRSLAFLSPGATEDVKWRHDICFSIGTKMSCVTIEDGGVSFKVTDDEFGMLTERTGIIPAPYMARNMWVFAEAFSALKDREWKQYVSQSYGLIRSKLPKKLQAGLG